MNTELASFLGYGVECQRCHRGTITLGHKVSEGLNFPEEGWAGSCPFCKGDFYVRIVGTQFGLEIFQELMFLPYAIKQYHESYKVRKRAKKVKSEIELLMGSLTPEQQERILKLMDEALSQREA